MKSVRNEKTFQEDEQQHASYRSTFTYLQVTRKIKRHLFTKLSDLRREVRCGSHRLIIVIIPAR